MNQTTKTRQTMRAIDAMAASYAERATEPRLWTVIPLPPTDTRPVELMLHMLNAPIAIDSFRVPADDPLMPALVAAADRLRADPTEFGESPLRKLWPSYKAALAGKARLV